MPATDELIAPSSAVPALDDFDYQVQHFIETDSKMSAVLLATAGKRQPVVLKIARVDQRARAEGNRQAIVNTVLWLRRLGRYHGLVRLHPVAYKHPAGRLASSQSPAYCATLRQWPGQPEFLVMEYLPGGSLRDFVGARPLDIKTALWIAHHLARSLAYIHRRGCVHRDIKPENILFRNLPADPEKLGHIRPILVDFGVAAPCGEAKLVSGSRLWMAPELQEAYERSPLPVDPAWDVYALGLILCYMITGRRPRRKNYDYASVLAYRERAFVVLEQKLDARGGMTEEQQSPSPALQGKAASEAQGMVRLRLQQLIADMLDKEPTNRPTAQTVADATTTLLADLGAPLPVMERMRMRLEQSRRPLLTGRLQLALVAAVIVAVLLGNLGALLMPWPSMVDAREQASQTAAFSAPNSGDGAPTSAQQEDGMVTPPVQSVVLFQRQTPATRASSPEPTRVPLTPSATQPPPTLIPVKPAATKVPPTLIPFTPRPQSTPTAAPPTPTTIAPTRTPSAPVASSPTATPSRAPTRTPRPTAPVQPTATPLLAQIELLAPESGIHSAQGKVEFGWQIGRQPLAEDHCFELVFWNPAKPTDKRSPVGAGKATRRGVDFTALFDSSDPLLRTLIQSHQEFNWGVRIVSCAAPRTILQDVQQVRVYSYEGQ